MDANEHTCKKNMGKTLTDATNLGIQEVVGAFTGEPVGAAFFCCLEPIDGIWTIHDVVVVGACVMPAGYGVGNHRLFVIDFLTSSPVGSIPPRIIHATARCLNSDIQSAALKHTNAVDDQIERHQVIGRVARAQESTRSKVVPKHTLDKINEETKQRMRVAEKRCR